GTGPRRGRRERGRSSLPGGLEAANPLRLDLLRRAREGCEMSTGAPALWFIEQSGEKVSSLVTGISAKFTKKATSEARFVFSDGIAMRRAIDDAVRTGEPVVYTAKSIGTQRDGTQVAEFTVEWSFKKKS